MEDGVSLYSACHPREAPAPGDIHRESLERVGVAGPPWSYFRTRFFRWYAVREIRSTPLACSPLDSRSAGLFVQLLGPFRFRFLAGRAARGAGV